MDKQVEIIHHYIEAYNNLDTEGMLRDLHPDVVFENSSGGVVNMTLHGIDEFRRQADRAAQLFASRQQQVVHLTTKDETVEATIHYKGTLASDLPEGLKKGDTIELDGRSIFRFLGDKIIGITDIS